MLPQLSLLVTVALVVAVPVPANPAGHYLPQPGDSFTFRERIAVSGGYGNYSGYTETDIAGGIVNVTQVLPNRTANATYYYSGHYTNSLGTHYPWVSRGTFSFSAQTYRYVVGTDNQTGFEGFPVWFYMNDSLPVSSGFSILGTGMTVDSRDLSYALETGAGTYVATIYADGTGTYQRNDDYGVFDATYDWRAYYDPTTGYILGYNYTELDSDGHGDGFVYTDTLAVTATSYALTAATAPATYPVTFDETGLASGASWAVTFDGELQAGTGSSISFPGYANATYLYGVSSADGTPSSATGFVTVSGAPATTTVSFTAAAASSQSSGWAGSTVLYVVVALVVVVVLVVIALAAARRARRGPPLPRHSVGGAPRYGAPPPGMAPPPISLTPKDQPQIQQVVVKEVVKVNCRFCGSLIDSTAERCPFCGATRT